MKAREVSTLTASLCFWRVKRNIALNYLRNLRSHMFLHAFVGTFVLGILLLGLHAGFSFMFNWLLGVERQPFGEPMLKRLVGMVLLAFFSMLTFSNLIIMLTTSYISREVEFYMAQPLSHRSLFFNKFAESTLYSTWAFFILALPFFLALGGAVSPGDPFFRLSTLLPDAPLLYYPTAAILLIPFIIIPASLGAIIAMVVTAYFPAKKMFRLAVVLIATGLLSALISGRLAMMNMKNSRFAQDEIGRVMRFMGIGDVSWMPSTWYARGIRGSMSGDWSEVFFWGGLLVSTALMLLQVCYWLAPPLYYRGFCAAGSSGTSGRTRQGGLFKFFDTLLTPIPSSVRTLMVKDLTVFWRDPAQWGQLMILFGLLFIYMANLGSIARLDRIPVSLPLFQSFTSLFNIGATCFILAILTTRFIYPLLSLEGKQQWVIGLAPLERTRLVWVKYYLCWLASLGLAFPLILLSCYVIRTDLYITTLTVGTVFFLSMGLNSLAIGLGALMPNFQEDNPARIANGLGGTINIMLSLLYIAATLGLEAPILIRYVAQVNLGEARVATPILLIVWGLLIALQIVAIHVPLRLGLRRWKALEF